MALTREQKREYQRKWYAANRERVIAAVRAYALDNVDKIKEQQRQYREANRERLNAEARQKYVANRAKRQACNKAWASANADKVSSYKAEWYQANKAMAAARVRERRDEINARRRERYAADPSKVLAWGRAYVERNREKVAAKSKARLRSWRQANPERVAEKDARRRARKRNTAVGPIDYAKILSESGGICGICKKPLDLLGRDFDHIVPLARGGTHTADNIQVTHSHCNRAKGARVA